MEMANAVGTEYASNYLTVDTNSSLYSTTMGQSVSTWAGDWYETSTNLVYTAPSVTTVTQIIKEKEVTKEVERRSLYKVYVVDPRKNGKILMDGKAVIAVNENQAMLKAGLAEIAAKEEREIEDFDVYVQCVGTFIRPKKDVQRVKVEKEGTED